MFRATDEQIGSGCRYSASIDGRLISVLLYGRQRTIPMWCVRVITLWSSLCQACFSLIFTIKGSQYYPNRKLPLAQFSQSKTSWGHQIIGIHLEDEDAKMVHLLKIVTSNRSFLHTRLRLWNKWKNIPLCCENLNVKWHLSNSYQVSIQVSKTCLTHPGG